MTFGKKNDILQYRMERGHEQIERQEKGLAVIIMGSEVDFEHAKKITDTLKELGVQSALRIASAHKSTEHLLSMIEDYSLVENLVYIAVAGRSNALGGVIDANTTKPVISAPPYSDKFGGADIFSSIRMPSGISATVAAEAEMAALAAAKIFALNDPLIADRILKYQSKSLEKIIDADARMQNQTLQTV